MGLAHHHRQLGGEGSVQLAKARVAQTLRLLAAIFREAFFIVEIVRAVGYISEWDGWFVVPIPEVKVI
jgi:hypothetical protein